MSKFLVYSRVTGNRVVIEAEERNAAKKDAAALLGEKYIDLNAKKAKDLDIEAQKLIEEAKAKKAAASEPSHLDQQPGMDKDWRTTTLMSMGVPYAQYIRKNDAFRIIELGKDHPDIMKILEDYKERLVGNIRRSKDKAVKAKKVEGGK